MDTIQNILFTLILNLEVLCFAFQPVVSQSVTVMKQQYFRKEPVSISAAVGSNVTLECEVESRSGFVQWTKDGYALGFNKTIPGFPRYTFNADNSAGVFNLHIQSVSLDDDSEFQCQVGPSQLPLMHRPIRAGANLTVISPPLSIEIVGHENSSKYEVQENSSIKLQCIAKNAKPAARIVWYRGRSELTSSNREGNVSTSETYSKGRKFRLYHVTSEIHLQPSVEDDGVNYTCEAEHEALIGKRMRATVQLSVLYPPGVPFIKGYTEGEILRQGQDVELSCLSRGGNPPAQLVWYKNGEQVKAIYRPVGRISENIYSFKADVSDNKARLMCEASSVINSTRLTIEVNLTVYYAPVNVVVNGSSEARGGDTVPLSCSAGPSNPAAIIKWNIGSEQLENSVTRTVPFGNNGWMSYSNTTVFVPSNATQISVQCYGVNSHIPAPDKWWSHKITVLRPPGVPVLTGIDENTYIPSGSKRTLTCTSVGGHPLATLTLFLNDKEIPFTSGPVQLEGATSAKAVVEINDSDNEAVYKCEAKNSATSIPYSTALKMIVYFPPMGAKITPPKPEELKAGSTIKLTCEIGSSNPEPTVSWWADGIEVKEGITKSCKSGLYRGLVCVTELSLNLTSDMDGQRYICQAHNAPLEKIASSFIVLNVQYKPVISDLNETVFTEVEGNNLVISLQVSANPSKVRYTWSRDGGPLMENFDSKLNITHLQRSHSGLYSCEALNSLGSSTIEFRVIVLYPASILHISDVVLVAERQTATLNCTVDGNPLLSEHVYWKRDGFPMAAKTHSWFSNNITSSLTVYNVTLNDMGNFYCVVDNGIGGESNKSAFLVVKHKPIIDKSDALSKAAAQIGNDAKLVCIASGAPKVSFSWSKGGVKLPQNSSEKYTMYYEQWDVVHYKSTLRISNVLHQDYEKYGCKADNSLGSSAQLVTLQNVSQPDPPSDFEAINATHNSITLTWKPAFNGGDTASYQIRYAEADEDRPAYRTLSAGSETVFTVSKLNLATCYTFNILAYNKFGRSNYMRNELKSCSQSEGPPSLPSRGGMANETNSVRLPFAVGLVIACILIILNLSFVIFCMIRRSKKKCKDNAHQQANKSENTDLYSSNNFNDQLHAESITSVSEKSENCDKSYNPLDEGRCSALNTYLIEEIDYPFQDTSAYEIEVKPEKLSSYHRTSTICRNGSLCQRIDAGPMSIPGDPQFIAYPPPVQFAQCSLEYMSNPRGHILGPPPDVTVQTAQNVPLSTFNYNAEHDGQLV